MKAIVIQPETLQEIAKEVSPKQLRRLKWRMRAAKVLKYDVYYIPFYMHPEAYGIPRVFVADKEFLTKHFHLDGYYQNSMWIRIHPMSSRSTREAA